MNPSPRSSVRSSRPRRRVGPVAVLGGAVISLLILAGCSSDDSATPTSDEPATQESTDSGGAGDAQGSGSADPAALSTCLTDAGFFEVVDQADGSRPYTDDELDFFELDTEVRFTAEDGASGSISFYRSTERAEEQEKTFNESETDYAVGRTDTVVYTAVSGDSEAAIATIDGCLS